MYDVTNLAGAMLAHPLSANCVCIGCRSAIADGYTPAGLFPEPSAEALQVPREIAAEAVSSSPFALEFCPAVPGAAALQLDLEGLDDNPGADEPIVPLFDDFALTAPEPLPVGPTVGSKPVPRTDARAQEYSGPWPRKRHYHRCPKCASRGSNGTNCYKARCTTPVLMSSPCSWCR
jgi:hypothetical protein